MIEDIIREALRTHSYSVSDECVNEMVERIERSLDDTGWSACE